MATSRTGTTKYLRARRKAIARDQAAGITNCPLCSVRLDYDTPQLPNSAETDHIIPFENGGPDHEDNLRVTCRDCNVKRRSRERQQDGTTGTPHAQAKPFATSQAW